MTVANHLLGLRVWTDRCTDRWQVHNFLQKYSLICSFLKNCRFHVIFLNQCLLHGIWPSGLIWPAAMPAASRTVEHHLAWPWGDKCLCSYLCPWCLLWMSVTERFRLEKYRETKLGVLGKDLEAAACASEEWRWRKSGGSIRRGLCPCINSNDSIHKKLENV